MRRRALESAREQPQTPLAAPGCSSGATGGLDAAASRAATRDGTVLAGMVAAVIDAAVRAGVRREALFESAGLSAEALGDPDARVPYRSYMRIWGRITELVRDEYFGLHMAERNVEAGTFGLAGFLGRHAPTLGDLFERIIAYTPLINETTHTRLVRDGGLVRLIDTHRDPRERWPRHMAESLFVSWVVVARQATQVFWKPRRVYFQHACPGSTREHERLLGCRVEFEHPVNEIVLDHRILSLPVRFADARLSSYLKSLADDLVARLPSNALRGSESLATAVLGAIAAGASNIAGLARALNLSPRTLQRRLAESGTSVRELLDKARAQSARELLADHTLPTKAIAASLGFGDMRAFRRAFQRWTGELPRAFRARARHIMKKR